MTVSNGGLDDRAWLEVSLAAVHANAKVAASHAGVPLLPMVKAEAYGLGMMPVVRVLEELDPWGYGVATLEEGLVLREAGITRPVIVFTPALDGWMQALRDAGLQPALGSVRAVERWHEGGGGPWQLDVDTGMVRAGFAWDTIDRLDVKTLRDCAGVFTHFACADTDADATSIQRERFVAAVDALPSRPEVVHAANSASIFRGSDYVFDVVRPGIFLYGGRPGTHAPEPEPVASFHARVVHVTRIAAGQPVSYGWRWRAPEDAIIATVGAGYGDGVPRSLEGVGRVSIAGSARPFVGAVNMDVTLAHISTGSVDVGDVATFFGDEVTVDEWASLAGTNAYELLTGIGRRVDRRYV